MEILEALNQLDATNDEHWTQEGLPKLDVVSAILDQEVKRKEVTDAAPDFNREAKAAADADNTPPEPPAEPTDEEDLKAKLDAEIETQAKAVQDLDRALEQLKEEHRDARIQLKRLQLTRKQLVPQDSLGQAIRDYLDTQIRVRTERGQRIQQLRDAGLAEIVNQTKGAPIDEAMKRKNQRGTQRPTRGQPQ